MTYEKNLVSTIIQNNDINSAVGDSGYVSNQEHNPLRIYDVQVQPHVFGMLYIGLVFYKLFGNYENVILKF